MAHDDRDVDVDRWIEKAQQEAERSGDERRVVFLVDTCSAGTATGNGAVAVYSCGGTHAQELPE
ncbi:hypothetical protein [Streptomyces virginiae]|uniref:hypothetical protein n=1 Tax=Streptomyces virginiae TaxID=1961 RepID=UPI003700FB48